MFEHERKQANDKEIITKVEYYFYEFSSYDFILFVFLLYPEHDNSDTATDR